MWDMYRVILGCLQWSSLLLVSVMAKMATLTPAKQATDVGAFLSQRSGSRLNKDGTPPMQRP